MTNWKAGMKAVCVDATPLNCDGFHPTLKMYVVYPVCGVMTCPGCGSVQLDIGVRDTCSMDSICKCGDVENTGSMWLFSAWRFRPLLSQEQSELDAIEQEVSQEVEHSEPIPA